MLARWTSGSNIRMNVRYFIMKSKAEAETTPLNISRKERIRNYWKDRKERMRKYLEMVKYDYTEALKEVKDFAMDKPIKASIVGSFIGLGIYANKNNPDEISFRENFLVNGQELSLVGDPVRNPKSQSLQDYVSKAYNAGLLRRLNCGLFSIMWVDDYDARLGLFAARCEYLKPGWLDMRHRVIDVGFIGKWWISSRIMEEYDINITEWNEDGSPSNSKGQLKPMW